MVVNLSGVAPLWAALPVRVAQELNENNKLQSECSDSLSAEFTRPQNDMPFSRSHI